MKLSISVPDQLWTSARIHKPDLNPSQLVQEALRAMMLPGVTLHSRPAFAIPSWSSAFGEAVAALSQEAGDTYSETYTEGIGVARQLGWEALDQLAGRGWDIEDWLDEIQSHESLKERYGWIEDVVEEIRSRVEENKQDVEILVTTDQISSAPVQIPWEYGSGWWKRLSPTMRLALEDSLREVWEAVMRGGSPGSSGDGKSVGSSAEPEDTVEGGK